MPRVNTLPQERFQLVLLLLFNAQLLKSKKMKNKIYYFFLLLLLTTSSCEKYLKEDPKGLMSPDTYFKSASDGKAAITGIYALLKNNSMYGQLGLYAYYEMGADIAESNRSFTSITPMCNYSFNESNSDVSDQKMGITVTWKDCYRVILNANIILSKVEGNPAISKVDQDAIIGETLFLRSLMYYHLTNLWGDVPYYRGVLTITELSTLGRISSVKIRDEILQDLQRAQDLMPAAIVAKENGRASKWAAAMTMAKIYLIQKKWQLARDKCLEIINNSGHKLLSTYGEVFDPNKEYNAETIWELDFALNVNSQYEKGVPTIAGNGNWFPSMFCPRLLDEPKTSTDKNALIAALAKNGENFNGTGAQVGLPDFISKFPINDLRRPYNIKQQYEGINLVWSYFPKMWNLSVATSPRFNHSDNILIYRLADTYLMAAEAENELNGPANAYQYIHPIRKRAYVTQAEWELTGLSKDQFRSALQDERKWELACEGHRRMDLIRWGILLDVVKKTAYKVHAPSANILPRNVLFPIPLQEIILNPNLLKSDPTNNGYR